MPDAVADLNALLATLAPRVADGEFVFVTVADGRYGDVADLRPVASFAEDEGLTLIVPRDAVDDLESSIVVADEVFRMITLGVTSSLSAVGLTAAVADALARRGVSANVVAAFHHDHVFVPSDRADDALAALRALTDSVAP